MIRNKLKTLIGTLPLVFALHVNGAEQADSVSDPSFSIDPSKPIASLCQGEQRFTIIRDNRHGAPSITGAILNDLEECAKAGYENLIIELVPILTFEEIVQNKPSMKNKTLERALQISRKEYADLENKIFNEHVMQRVEFIDANSPLWPLAYTEAFREFYRDNPKIEKQRDDIFDVQSNLEMLVLLDKWYNHDPETTRQTLLQSGFWEISLSENEADRQKTKENIVDIIVKSRDLGMRVHFYGDNPEGNSRDLTTQHFDIASAQWDYIETEIIKKNQDLAPSFSDASEKIMAFLPKTEQEAERFCKSLASVHYYLESLCLNDANGKLLDTQYMESRFGARVLEFRAKAFMKMSNGKKTMVAWGAGHFNNEYAKRDIDEYLERELKQDARKTGQDFVPIKQIDLYPSKTVYEDDVKNFSRKDSDLPDLRYFIKEGVVEILNADYTRQKANAQQKETISHEI